MAKRRDPFANQHASDNDPLHNIPIAKPYKREDRSWEKANKAFSCHIPVSLEDRAIAVRDAILWISQHDENGNLRSDQTTVDDVATTLIDYALAMAAKENITFRPTAKGKMTLSWNEAEAGWNSPIAIGEPVRKKKNVPSKTMVLSYRWTPEHQGQIEVLAGKTGEAEQKDDGTKKPNPYRFAVPIGEVIVVLLERAVSGYQSREMCLLSHPVSTAQTVDGWASK